MSKLVQVDLNLQKWVQNCSSWSNLVQYWLKLDQIHQNFICFCISGKRIAKVVGISMECDKMIEDYETFTSDLLKWIETKIAELGTRDFANSLRGVQVSFRFRPFCKKTPKNINFSGMGQFLQLSNSKILSNHRVVMLKNSLQTYLAQNCNL